MNTFAEVKGNVYVEVKDNDAVILDLGEVQDRWEEGQLGNLYLTAGRHLAPVVLYDSQAAEGDFVFGEVTIRTYAGVAVDSFTYFLDG